MWDSRMWQGLMRWVEDEKCVERRHVVESAARRQIAELLARDKLDELTLDEFNRTVWQFGGVVGAGGEKILTEDFTQSTTEEIQHKLASGEWRVEGNQTVGSGTSTFGPMLQKTDEEKVTSLRSALGELLYSSDDLFDNAARVAKQTMGLGYNSMTLILCMTHPHEMGIWNQQSVAGMKKLASLLGTEAQWADKYADYRPFNELLLAIRANSGGVLEDLLAVDAFLYRLTLLEEPGYWKVALGLDSRQHEELAQRCKEGGFAAIGWGPEDEDPKLNVQRFEQIQPGDYVVMHLKGKIGGVGRVVRPHYKIDRDGADEVVAHWWRRIDVDWILGDRDYADLLPGAKRMLTVVDLNEGVFRELADMYADDPRFSEVIGGNGPDDDRRRVLAHTCLMKQSDIARIERLLREKGQAIFYGPPGTGKTFVALKLAEYLAEGNPNRWELIQFHPSYTYEDFMEGIKPESVQVGERWEVSYPVRAGSFMRFCERARNDPGNTYIFVIDEINRGQIAKIFGELMFLLEYRHQEIELAYTKSSPDGSDSPTQDTRQRFSIPTNVLIIGTMNTADRSIALVDHALRRRFVFYPFYPDDADFVQPMLRKWLHENAEQMSWVADLLDGLNEKLEDDVGRDLLLGHSYFMREGLDEDKLREIWHFQIEPLLQEYFVGSPKRVQEYDLKQLVAKARGGEEGYGGDDSNDKTHRRDAEDAENDSNDEA